MRRNRKRQPAEGRREMHPRQQNWRNRAKREKTGQPSKKGRTTGSERNSSGGRCVSSARGNGARRKSQGEDSKKQQVREEQRKDAKPGNRIRAMESGHSQKAESERRREYAEERNTGKTEPVGLPE